MRNSSISNVCFCFHCNIECDGLESILFKGCNFVDSSLQLENLPKLRQLEVREESFSSCSTLRLESCFSSCLSEDLPSLETVGLGRCAFAGYNSYLGYTTLVLKGSRHCEKLAADLPKLSSIRPSARNFVNFNRIVIQSGTLFSI